MGLEFELRTSTLQNKHSTMLSHTSSLFAPVILEIGSLRNYLPKLVLNHDPLLQPPKQLELQV
jgi:hypothetical protein